MISSNFQVKLHRQSQSVRLGCSQHTAKKLRGFKFQSPNSVEPLPGHLWWTELPSVLGHEQAHPPLFVQGGGKSYGSPCIKCTCWTCVQPWWGDNVTASFRTPWQSTVKLFFLQMQCIVSRCMLRGSKIATSFQACVLLFPLPTVCVILLLKYSFFSCLMPCVANNILQHVGR